MFKEFMVTKLGNPFALFRIIGVKQSGIELQDQNADVLSVQHEHAETQQQELTAEFRSFLDDVKLPCLSELKTTKSPATAQTAMQPRPASTRARETARPGKRTPLRNHGWTVDITTHHPTVPNARGCARP